MGRLLPFLAAVLLIAAPFPGCGSAAQEEDGAARVVPQLAGLTEAEARSVLEEGEWPFQIEYLPGPPDQASLVLSQQPASGEVALEDQLVILAVGAPEESLSP